MLPPIGFLFTVLLSGYIVLGRRVFSASDETNTRKKEYDTQYAIYGYHLYVVGTARCIYKIYGGSYQTCNAKYGKDYTKDLFFHFSILVCSMQKMGPVFAGACRCHAGARRVSATSE